MKHPNPNILLYICMADAYAMQTEYLKPHDSGVLQEALEFKRYGKHPRHKTPAGGFTDDGEMNIANARVLLATRPPHMPTALEFATTWLEEFDASGQREGYAGGFYSALCKAGGNGHQLIDGLKTHGNTSDKNGAAMRAPVLGVLRDPVVVCEVATTQARITHDSPAGIFSARAVALMSHFALHLDDAKHEMGRFCREYLPNEDRKFFHVFERPWPDKPVTGQGMSVAIATVHAAYHIIQTYKTLMDMLEAVIRLGGDTDTVAAIVWGIASTRQQLDPIPEFMPRDLEQGHPRTGARALIALGTQLMDAYR